MLIFIENIKEKRKRDLQKKMLQENGSCRLSPLYKRGSRLSPTRTPACLENNVYIYIYITDAWL
jgi:hypothetical protein